MKTFTVAQPQVQLFRRRLLRWYKQHGRDLPWRTTHNPYRIIVSEIMLQQTQVDRVVPRYQRWLKHFPTVSALAQASPRAVLTEWSGLGYNRRALTLRRLAQDIVSEYNGRFPTSLSELMALPGVGRYTASAVMAFAFQQRVPMVDTNVKRVLGRIFFGYKKLAKLRHTDEPFWFLQERYHFHQGIMDFGALVCTAKKPRCLSCPMRSICQSYPAILTAQPHYLRVKTSRQEPLFFGQPRRIWRGKILAYLKNQPSHKARLTTIGHYLQTDWSKERIPWLQQVVTTMERDQLVTIQKRSLDWIISY